MALNARLRTEPAFQIYTGANTRGSVFGGGGRRSETRHRTDTRCRLTRARCGSLPRCSGSTIGLSGTAADLHVIYFLLSQCPIVLLRTPSLLDVLRLDFKDVAVPGLVGV